MGSNGMIAESNREGQFPELDVAGSGEKILTLVWTY